ncbi:MAG: alpha-amylase, partial [Oscillibacter sp.]|nr:alpha-amylase [Oscillibacter sp.]
EFFYRKSDGSMGNHVGDWTDVVDLDYTVPALWDYQIESLVQWAKVVDGFRCDVASFVPVEFWCKAREAVEQVRPGAIWLAETVHSGFGQFSRQNGMYSASDYEMFRAFDMEYDYDIREVFDRYLKGEGHLSNYIDMLNFQECLYPANHIKMRCLENHDQPRICSFVKEEKSLRNFTAFLYFLKGTTLLYGGQEYCCVETPSLFEKDLFPREGRDITAFLQKMYSIKKNILSHEDYFKGSADDGNDIAILAREDAGVKKLGVFSLKGREADVKVDFPDGSYENAISGETVTVQSGILRCAGEPIILSTK